MSTLTAPTKPLRPPVVRVAGISGVSVRARGVAPGPGTRVRWGRVVGLVLVALLVVWLVGAGFVGPSDADSPPAAPVTVVVQPGDTVWDLARTYAPSGVPTLEYVMLVEQHNDVRSGALVPGSVLELPRD